MTTPPQPPAEDHLGLDALADLDAGLLRAEQEAPAQAHLAGCERCGADQAALRDVRAALAADDPGPMPASVAARLDAALSGAVSTGSGSGSGSAGTLPSLAAARERRARRRFSLPTGLVGAAAALALLVGGGALAVRSLDLSGGGSISASQSAGGSSGGEAARNGREAGGSAASTGSSPTAEPPLTGADAAVAPLRLLHTGQAYSPSTLATQVRFLLEPAPAPGGQPPPPGTPGAEGSLPTPSSTPTRSGEPPSTLQSATSGRATPPGLAGCLDRQGVAEGTRPLAVDTGTWRGRPAMVVVLPGEDSAHVRGLVLAAGCSSRSSRLLYDTTLAR